MSMSRQISVTCKQCGKEHPFTAWESLNVTHDRDFKQQLLKGQLTRFTCPDCASSTHVLHPILYHDMDKRLMLWLWLEKGEPDTAFVPVQRFLDEYQFRIVSTYDALVEKIFIFDRGLDDRLVEFLKLLLQIQASQGNHPVNGEIRFTLRGPRPQTAGSLVFEYVGQTGAQSFAVPGQAYTELARSLVEKLPKLQTLAGKWLRIDRAFAESLAHQFL